MNQMRQDPVVFDIPGEPLTPDAPDSVRHIPQASVSVTRMLVVAAVLILVGYFGLNRLMD